MKYVPYGPLRLPSGRGLLEFNKQEQDEFWAGAAGDKNLGDACGCYVFALRAGRGIKPWYVGKAERQSFRNECFTAHKIIKFVSKEDSQKGTPLLYLYARVTEKGKFSRPTTASHADVEYLEKMLISMALRRNGSLLNLQNTKMLREMVVPGLLNSGRGKLSASANELRRLMGY